MRISYLSHQLSFGHNQGFIDAAKKLASQGTSPEVLLELAAYMAMIL